MPDRVAAGGADDADAVDALLQEARGLAERRGAAVLEEVAALERHLAKLPKRDRPKAVLALARLRRLAIGEALEPVGTPGPARPPAGPVTGRGSARRVA